MNFINESKISNDKKINNNESIKNSTSTNTSSNQDTNIYFYQNELTKKSILSCLNAQNTAIILQRIISEASKEVIDNIVNELKGTYRELIKDKNGNYFCSDLFKMCEKAQRIKILNELSKTICEDSTHKFATYPIQILIEFSSSEEEYKLILYSFHDYKQLILTTFDSCGSYVINKIIEHIPEKFRYQFNLLFIAIIPLISLKQFGVCCCKKFISFTTNEEIIEKMINIIIKNFIKISTNNFGNFLIQFILKKLNNTRQGERIKEEIINNYKDLSENKYSFYICDLFLKLASNEDIKKIIIIHNINPYNIKNNNNQILDQKNFGQFFLGHNINLLGQNHIPFSLNNTNFKENYK